MDARGADARGGRPQPSMIGSQSWTLHVGSVMHALADVEQGHGSVSELHSTVASCYGGRLEGKGTQGAFGGVKRVPFINNNNSKKKKSNVFPCSSKFWVFKNLSGN